MNIGDEVPDVSAVDQDGRIVKFRDLRGRQPIVVFFYPANDSPICTREACSFRDAYEDFLDAGAAVFGVSGDTNESHQKFAARHRLPFPLLSDADGRIRKAFGVHKSLGIVPARVTYIIDDKGIVRHIFESQFAAHRHVQEALKILRQLETPRDGALNHGT